MPRKLKKPTYTPTTEESEAHRWCMKNNYVIYPVELSPMSSNYKIHIELGHKHAVLEEIYTASTLWSAFFKLCVRIKEKQTKNAKT